MAFSDSFKSHIHSITASEFESAALELYDYQWHENKVYQEFCQSLNKNPANTRTTSEIPFLPIDFFKKHQIMSGQWQAETQFKSSGTTQSIRSTHYVRDVDFYLENAKKCFEYFYGALSQFSLKALLPSYQEQGDSSLIAMVDHFMAYTDTESGYFLDQYAELAAGLREGSTSTQLLIGVSFALLDMIEAHGISVPDVIVMETGGMKGRRRELTRQELHGHLTAGFGVQDIHSEYGMTELMSQAYAKSQGILRFPPWAGILIRDINDPLSYVEGSKTGGVNIIDLANVDSCGFIETMDLGRRLKHGQFEILGRFDNSDVRGCNLLVA